MLQNYFSFKINPVILNILFIKRFTVSEKYEAAQRFSVLIIIRNVS